MDLTGRSVSRRGYLIDNRGNIVNKNGDILFKKASLNEDGDIPKFFHFSKFDQKKIKGAFDGEPGSLPVILEDPELPAGYGRDTEDAIVNQMGFLANPETQAVIDRNGNDIFMKTELTEDGNLAPVLRKAAARFEGLDAYESDPNQRFETDDDYLTESEYGDGTRRQKTVGFQLLERREFNENDILGRCLRDEFDRPLDLKLVNGVWYDQNGKEVNMQGFMVDRNGNIINHEGQIIFSKD